MSMIAKFVQIDPVDLSRMKNDPTLVEELFIDGPAMPPQFTALAQSMQDRVRTAGPQLLAAALERMDPILRKQVEASLGRTAAALAGGAGGEELLKMVQSRLAGRTTAKVHAGAVLSLDKSWHGVHFILCGKAEPDDGVASQAVMGGTALGDEDDEGFSGYGPARCFTVEQVNQISNFLNRPEVEQEAERRFDAAAMSKLGIYPGWRQSDLDSLMDYLRSLRAYYADAASKSQAVVTCLV